MIRNVYTVEALYAIEHAAEILNYDEPMPRPNERNIQKLEACIERPFTVVAGRYQFWTLAHRAAVLFYTIIKNHPLENGNKRSAVILTMLLLYVNGKTLKASPDQVYKVACMVAESPASQSELQINLLKSAFKEFIVELM